MQVKFSLIYKVCLVCILLVNVSSIPPGLEGKEISRSFELRYFSNAKNANGETDFKGKTSILNTEQRIDFLKRYAEYATNFFNDPHLDKMVVAESEIAEALQKVKPQPLPDVRERIQLTDWKYTGFRNGIREEELSELSRWNSGKSMKADLGSLHFTDINAKLDLNIDSQKWRMRMEWKAFITASSLPVSFAFNQAIQFGIDEKAVLSYITSGRKITSKVNELDKWTEFIVEPDLETGRYNLFMDNQLIADFVELSGCDSVIDHLEVKAGKGFRMDDIWGVGYRKTENPDVPFSIETFVNEDFEVHPDMKGWQLPEYDDSGWKPVPRWPYAHGGERQKGEFLYLRTKLRMEEFEQATLSGETMSPSGEIWINGEVVHVQHNEHPFEIDITKYLHPGSDNFVAVKINPDKVEFTNRHTPADIYTGWFAGRMWVDLTDKRRIKDLFVFTEKIGKDTATLGLEAVIRNDHVIYSAERERRGSNTFEGQLSVELKKWFPLEGQTSVVNQTFPVSVYLGQDKKWKGEIKIAAPDLWTTETPNLYKVTAELKDTQGNIIDDYVVTTGIRTVSQEGGTFRINGQPAMMNGALSAAFRAPLERIAQWFRCGPDEKIVQEILMLKKMNANTMRMTLNDGVDGNINDPRYAEFGDQLGIMFQWGTTAWVRTDSPYIIDFEGLPKYIRQVRNHPSIVMWQPANHPLLKDFDDAIVWIEEIYNSIIRWDRSRLISPTANSTRIKPPNDKGTLDHKGNPVEPNPVWTAPMITRGSMDYATGYGAEWSTLRSYPYPRTWSGVQNWLETGYRTDYLASKERAYFDFESEESIGQPNWKLHRGKPQYKVQSYEYKYNEGSIGRLLSTDEWKESQAWQAMSGYEAYRKKRWLDYDGQAWCNLRGGHNTATYQKPLIDYYGHAKLSFYAIRMVFQPVLAGSKNVDVVYGPEDKIPVVVMNIGPQRRVTVTAVVRDLKMKEVYRKNWENVILPEGRSFTDIDVFRPHVKKQGIYAVEYSVKEND